MGWRERVLDRLAQLKMTKQQLAELAGLSPSYIYKLLMVGPGGRENPSKEVLERIARALGLPPRAFDESLPLGEYILDRLHGLPPEQRAALGRAGTAERFQAVYRLMQEEPRWRTEEAVAAALRLSPETIRALLDGAEPDAGLVRHLADVTRLSVRWWIRGRLDPNPALVTRVIEHEDAQGYLEVLALAMEAGISSQTLKAIITAIVRGDS